MKCKIDIIVNQPTTRRIVIIIVTKDGVARKYFVWEDRLFFRGKQQRTQQLT